MSSSPLRSLPPAAGLTFQQVTALYRLSKLVPASVDLDLTLSASVDVACELTDADLSAVLLFDEDQHLVQRARHDHRAAAAGGLVAAPAGLVRRALDERRTVIGPNASLATPLIWEGLVIGVLTAAATAPRALGVNDVALFEEVAQHAAAAVAHDGAFAQAREDLAQTERLRTLGQLADGIAHQLNTPVGVIMSNLSVLQEYGTVVAEALRSGDQSGNLDYIVEDLPQLASESMASAERIAAIVRGVAILAGQESARSASFTVQEAFEAALALTSNELRQRLRVVRDFTGAPPVTGQLSGLTHVFVRLLLDACQALPTRLGTITVTTACDDRDVSVELSDNGCGLAPEHLAACHAIVTRFGGAIATRSDAAGGTSVTVRLPRAVRCRQEAA